MIETMNKVVKGFCVGLIVIAAALVPACRSKKAPPAPKVAPTETTAPVPNVPTVATTTETRVTNPPDVVQTQTTPQATVEQLRTAAEDPNRGAAQRGY